MYAQTNVGMLCTFSAALASVELHLHSPCMAQEGQHYIYLHHGEFTVEAFTEIFVV